MGLEKSKKNVVIVDGYSAGNLLAPEFAKWKAQCIHVQSTPQIWPILKPSFRPEDYIENFAHDPDNPQSIDHLLEKLRPLGPSVVLAGTETGVELADQLGAGLGTPCNELALSEARRNKFLMIEAVRKAKVEAPRQTHSDKLADIIAWYRSTDMEKIVLKPLKSAGTDGFNVCQNASEIAQAFESIMGKTNKLGLFNHSVLAQEYLEGDEYFINTVSCRDKVIFTDIWRYEKRSINQTDHVYDRNILCPYDGPRETQIRKYVYQVLKALGVTNGPAHTEVMWTAQGPRLIEIGTRLDGLSVPAVNTEALGFGPLELTVMACLDPESFLKKVDSSYHLRKQANTVYLTSYKAGEVASIPGQKKLESLRSFYQARLRVEPGKNIAPTTNYFTAPGFFTLIHPDEEVIERDYQFIRQLEQKGEFFILKDC